MSTFFTKLSLCPSKEGKIGGNSREEEKHWHLPNIHEYHPKVRHIFSTRAPTETLHIPFYFWSVGDSDVKQQYAPCKNNPQDVNIRAIGGFISGFCFSVAISTSIFNSLTITTFTLKYLSVLVMSQLLEA